MSTVRGRPPRVLCLAGGSIGPTIAHGSSVRSEGYRFRDWPSSNMFAHSSADGKCANDLTKLLFWQELFPDSLSVTHRRAIRLGALGLVRKEQASGVLLQAITKVHAGEVW